MMREITNSIAIIPARAGSKSVKNKNIRLFNGKPLIAWTIEQALESNISRVIVTTNSKKIREIALEYGAEVPFLRSEELSTDTMAIEPVLLDVVNYLDINESYHPDCVVLLQPTSPFRTVDDINKALKIYKDNDLTSVVTVSRAIANQNPYWMLKRNKTTKQVELFTGKSFSEMKIRRQDLPEVYIRNDFAYIIEQNNLRMNPPNLYGDKVDLMIIDDERLDVDINTEAEWLIAETIFNRIVQ